MSMKERKWKDCPVCGKADSMDLHRGVNKTLKTKSGYSKTIEIDLYVCDSCNEGIPTNAASKIIAETTAELKALELSNTVLAKEIASVEEVMKMTNTTRQAVHKMMKTGRLESVYVADKRYPLKKELHRIQMERIKQGLPESSDLDQNIKSRSHKNINIQLPSKKSKTNAG